MGAYKGGCESCGRMSSDLTEAVKLSTFDAPAPRGAR